MRFFNEKGRQPGSESGGVVLCCDMHGHSRNMDLFSYHCIDELSTKNLVIRAIPVGIDKRVPIFNINSCNFANQKEKENSARIVLFKNSASSVPSRSNAPSMALSSSSAKNRATSC